MNATGFYKMVHLGPFTQGPLRFPDLTSRYLGRLALLLAQDL